MLARDILFENWNTKVKDSENCQIEFSTGVFFGRTFYSVNDINPILQIFDEAIASKENTQLFFNNDSLLAVYELISLHSTPHISEQHLIPTLKSFYTHPSIVTFTYDNLQHLINLSIVPSLGDDPFIPLFFEKFVSDEFEYKDKHTQIIASLYPLFDYDNNSTHGNFTTFAASLGRKFPLTDLVKIISICIISKTISHYNLYKSTDEWSKLIISESFIEKTVCVKLQPPPELEVIPSKSRLMKRNILCYKGHDLHLMASYILGVDQGKLTALVVQEPWQIETLAGALYIRLRQYILDSVYKNDYSLSDSTYNISLISNGIKYCRDALDELLQELIPYDFKIKTGIVKNDDDFATISNKFSSLNIMLGIITKIHLKVQRSAEMAFEPSFTSLTVVRQSLLDNSPEEYKDDKLYLALVDDFLTHTLSSLDLIRKLANMYPKHYCKANIVIDLYNRIGKLTGREFLITSDSQFPITEFNETQIQETCIIYPEDFSSRFFILLGIALSKATIPQYKRYMNRYLKLSALDKTLSMLRLFGLDYTLERQGLTVKKHHLVRLESRSKPLIIHIQARWRGMREIIFLKLLKYGVVRIQSIIRRELYCKTTTKAKDLANDFIGLIITLVAIRNGFIPSKITLQMVRKMELRFQTQELELLRIAATTFIQSYWRMFKARRQREELEKISIINFSQVIIQGLVKSVLARDYLCKLKYDNEVTTAVLKIQSAYRGFIVRRRYMILRGLAITIPSIIRKGSRLQSLSVRLRHTRNKEMRDIISLEMQLPPKFTKVQNLFRMYYIRKQYKLLHSHLQLAHAFAMTKIARLKFETLRNATIKIQRFFRSRRLVLQLNVHTVRTLYRLIDLDERSSHNLSLNGFKIIYYKTNCKRSWYSGGWGLPLFQILSYIDKIKSDGNLTASLAIGRGHSLFLVKFGESTLVFSWGSNERGQLGRTGLDDAPKISKTDTNTRSSLSGNLFQPIFKNHIKSIYAGNEFSCCLDQSGVLYTWGDNRFGQCGHGHRLITIPTPTYLIEGVDRVVVGSSHCYARSMQIDYIWGSATCIGLTHENWYVPTRLDDYLGESVELISLGENENGATLYNIPNILYLWSSNKIVIEAIEFSRDITIKSLYISKNLKCIVVDRRVPLSQPDRKQEYIPKSREPFMDIDSTKSKDNKLIRSPTFGFNEISPRREVIGFKSVSNSYYTEVCIMGMIKTDEEASREVYTIDKKGITTDAYTLKHYSRPIRVDFGDFRITNVFADKFMIVISCDFGKKIFATDCFTPSGNVLIPNLFQFTHLRDSNVERDFDLVTNYLSATIIYGNNL